MSEPTIHIHAPSGFTFRAIQRCRRCRVRRRMVITWFMWYGPIVRCCRCGAYVNDGELKPPRKTIDPKVARLMTQTWPTLPNRFEALLWLRGELDALRAAS